MRNILWTLTLIGLAMPLAAEQYFVLFDASCMQRLEYEQAISQQPRMAYFSYQIPLAGDRFLTLETGVEGTVTQDYLPDGYLGCNHPILTEGLAERINGNSDRVFMLVPSGNGTYLVQPVTMATIRNTAGNALDYESPLAHFSFDTDNGIIGENLAIDNPGARVYFEGRDNAACTNIYLFRQLMPRNAYPVIDYKISRELGVIERRLGSDGNSTLGGVVMLRKINGQPLNSYLANWCSQSQSTTASTTANQPQVYYGTTSIPNTGYTPPASTPPSVVQTAPVPATTSPVPNIPAQTTNTTHTVSRGETLYGLSRTYSTSVDQIKQWNNLSSNDIFPGQQLIVGQSVAQPTTFSNNVVTLGPSFSSNGPDPAEVQNTNTLTNNAPTTQQYYTVQPGETVASVALRLGFTEAKFREINNLGPTQVIRVGQRLKVNDCNCPDNQPALQSTQAVTNRVLQPGVSVNPTNQPAAPTTFSQQPRIGSSAGNNANSQAPAQGFDNSPNFGTVIPEAYQPPRSSMADLENRANSGSPSTYNNSNPYGNTNFTTPQTYNNPNQNRAIHVVQEGESLYSIATRYNLSVAQLRQLNGMTATDIIIPFQRLFVN
ncbi:MAG: LysM peptidoglycan-binding domain-containing protein [Bacteroidota bacterium]